MMECVRLIIGGDREREGERGKRSVDRLIQNNLGGREGTAMLGTKRGCSRRLPTPPTPREVASLHSDYNPTPKTKRVFEVVPWCDGYRQWKHEEILRGRGNPDERRRVPIHIAHPARFLD